MTGPKCAAISNGQPWMAGALVGMAMILAVGDGGEADDSITGSNFSYLAERLAGPFGEGIIHVYQLNAVEAVFTDGFENGDTSAWSSTIPTFEESP